MYAPDMGRPAQGEAQDVAQSMVIDPRCHRGHQHHRQSGILASVNGLDLYLCQGRAPEGPVNFIVQTVKLQKHHADPRLCQEFRVARLPGDAQAVGVQLEEGEALLPSQGDDLVQIVPHGGLAAGELDVEGAAVVHQVVILLPDLLQGEVLGRFFARAGEADGTLQITAVGQLQQHAAAVPLMALAQAAVVGTAPFHLVGPDRGHGGVAVPCAPGHVLSLIPLPDQGPEAAVFPAGFVHIDPVFLRHQLRRDLRQAHGADGMGRGEWLHSRSLPSRISIHFS